MTVDVISLDSALGLAAANLRARKGSADRRVDACRDSVAEFARYCWLKHPTRGKMHPSWMDAPGASYDLWDWQAGMLELWAAERLVCVLKARQLGVSWLVAIYVLWLALFRPGTTVLLVSIGQREADELLDKVKFILRHLPPWLRPHGTVPLARSITFANGSEIESLPSSGATGRSRTASLVVLDEHAWQANDVDIWTAIEPTVEAGQLLSVSTGNGLGPLHTRLYKGAVEGVNGFVPVFIPWTAHPDRDEEWERQERARMSVSNQPQLFEQEYPSNDVEAFIITGSPVWTAAELEALPKREVEPREPGLWVYEEPVPGERYIIGADTAEGVVGGDWCSASVLRVMRDEDGYRGEQVAVLRGLWPPEVYAERLHRLATYYAVGYEARRSRTCWLGVERNNHGHAVLLRLRQLNPKDQPYGLSSWKKALGWVTDPQTRPLMYDQFAGAVRSRAVSVVDPVSISQMSTFAAGRNGGAAQSGFHDDDVTALAIAWAHHRRSFGPLLDVPPSAR